MHTFVSWTLPMPQWHIKTNPEVNAHLAIFPLPLHCNHSLSSLWASIQRPRKSNQCANRQALSCWQPISQACDTDQLIKWSHFHLIKWAKANVADVKECCSAHLWLVVRATPVPKQQLCLTSCIASQLWLASEVQAVSRYGSSMGSSVAAAAPDGGTGALGALNSCLGRVAIATASRVDVVVLSMAAPLRLAKVIHCSIVGTPLQATSTNVITFRPKPSASTKEASVSDQFSVNVHVLSTFMDVGIGIRLFVGLCFTWVLQETDSGVSLSGGTNEYTPCKFQSTLMILSCELDSTSGKNLEILLPPMCARYSLRTFSNIPCLWQAPCGQVNFMETP